MELGELSERARMDALPSGWQSYTIGQTLTLINGLAFKPSEWKAHGTPIVRIQNLNDDDSSYNYCDDPISDKYHIRAGDILFAWSGTTGTSFGARIWTGPNAVLNQHIFKVVPDKTKLTPYYSFLVLQNVQKEIERRAHGFKSSFVHVKKSDLTRVPLTIPPIPEQRAIVEALSEIDRLIAELERLMKKKGAIKQAMMQRLFGDWSNGAPRATIGSVTSWLSGGTPDRSNTGYWDGTIPWISATTLKRSEVADSDQKVSLLGVRAGSKMAPLGSTLVLVRGSALHSEIRASLVIAPVCFNQDVKALIPSSAVVPKFLTYSIHGNADRLLRLVTSAGNTAGVLDTPVLKSLSIWLPDRKEQERVVAVLDDVMEDLDVTVEKLMKARYVKQGMMQQLLTGRIRLV